MTAKKFTFRKLKKTGEWRSFQTDYTDIKLDKKIVGAIQEAGFEKYKIYVHIKAEDQVAGFRTVKFKKDFESENEAREFLNKNFKQIMEKYKIFQIED